MPVRERTISRRALTAPLVAAHPNDPELHRALGRALLLQKKFPEAQQELLAAVRLKRDSPDAYVDLAFAASENKNYDLTVRALNGRASLNAEMPVICFFLRASAYDHLARLQAGLGRLPSLS